MGNIASMVVSEHLCCPSDQDENGFDFIECICGYRTNAVPGVDIAVDQHVGHVVTILVETLEREGFM